MPPSGDWSTKAKSCFLWSKRSTLKPPRLDFFIIHLGFTFNGIARFICHLPSGGGGARLDSTNKTMYIICIVIPFQSPSTSFRGWWTTETICPIWTLPSGCATTEGYTTTPSLIHTKLQSELDLVRPIIHCWTKVGILNPEMPVLWLVDLGRFFNCSVFKWSAKQTLLNFLTSLA